MAFTTEVQLPSLWPSAPEDLSFSTLKAIEACPRRYALEHASYPWGSGYPRAVSWGALEGSVIHGAMDEFAKAYRGLPTDLPAGERATAALQASGLLPGLLDKGVAQVVKEVLASPRAAPHTDAVKARLTEALPKLRVQLQRRLGFTNLPAPTGAAARGGAPPGAGTASLPPGGYPEIAVRAPSLRWKGKLDLLAILPVGAEILEFKTGAVKPEHQEQVEIYALLWAREARNPTAAPPVRLSLIYPNKRQELQPLTAAQLSALEERLIQRSKEARAALAQTPPPAKPSPDGCRWCGVRHLCDAYWAGLPGTPSDDSGFLDLEVVVTGRRAEVIDATVSAAHAALLGRQVSLLSQRGLPCREGQRLRLLGARWTPPDEGEGRDLVHLGSRAEVFQVVP